jgi:hypothetical protein
VRSAETVTAIPLGYRIGVRSTVSTAATVDFDLAVSRQGEHPILIAALLRVLAAGSQRTTPIVAT